MRKLAMNRSMGWLSPRRRQRASCILTWMWASWQYTGAWAGSAPGGGKELHIFWPECEQAGNEQEHGLAEPQEEAKSLMYSELIVSKLVIHRCMGWISPRRRQRSSSILTWMWASWQCTGAWAGSAPGGGKDLHVLWPEFEQAGNAHEQGLAQS